MFGIRHIDLEVHEALENDAYHDRVRIPERFRQGLQEGRICKLNVGNRSRLVEVRGLIGETREIIRVDDKTRELLGGLAQNTRHSFRFRPVWWIGQLRWTWASSDPGARIASRLGLLSFVLGLIALLPLIRDGIARLLSHFFSN